MRRLLIVGTIAMASIWMACPLCNAAQETSTPSPASAQQQTSGQRSEQVRPQKKAEAKTQKNAKAETKAHAQTESSSSSGAATHPASDENPFPEQVSRDAAKSQEQTPAAPAPSSPSTSDSNPFPEAVSRSAAKAAGGDSSDSQESQSPNPSNPTPSLPPGVSSSQASSLTRETGPGQDASRQSQKPLEVTNPARAKKDTQIGNYYLAAGNPKGAYLRYQDATATDPTNVDAIFGLAEAARQLNKIAEAERNYQMYLAITPNGPKAKAAVKALHSLAGKR